VTIFTVFSHEGKALTYDSDDVDTMELSTPADVVDTTDGDGRLIRRDLGQRHLHLSLHFKEGKGPEWVDQ
jgi:hypothetical protein